MGDCFGNYHFDSMPSGIDILINWLNWGKIYFARNIIIKIEWSIWRGKYPLGFEASYNVG